MNNSQNNKEFPANKALQHFFDDLTLSPGLRSSVIDTQSKPSVDEEVALKISQAERLLEKANNINTVLSEASINPVVENTELVLHNFPPVVTEKNSKTLDSSNSAVKEHLEFTDIHSEGQTRSLALTLKDSLSNRFQVLLFKISNVTIAIPLIELGGIHQLTKISKVARQPTWCKGILLKGTEKFTCIDASSWLMPHKVDGTLALENECKFGVQLGKTKFLLCCNSISETVELSKDDVKWRKNTNLRPWLAGLLKEEMCALIDGAQMVRDMLK